MQIGRSLVVVLVGAAVAAGCGGGSDDPSATAGTSVTRSEEGTDPTTTAPPPTTAPPATTAPAPATTTSAPPPADGGGGGGGADEAVLPDAVGLDLQLAQDTMQASGFYFLTSHDASGQGRLQILDRNWKVCDQSPAGGAPASPDTLIDFGAVKDDESCGAG